MLKRFGAGALLTICAVLASTAPANAFWAETTTWKSGTGRVWFYAEPGEVNDVTAFSTETAAGVDVIVRDSKATVTPPPAGHGTGCEKVDDHTLRCTNVDPFTGFETGIQYMHANLGDGDDNLLLLPGSGLSLVADGEGGNDTIKADDPERGATLDGGAGDDRLTIRGGGGGSFDVAVTYGGAGNDVLDINNDYDDKPMCNDGWDLVYADAKDTPYYDDSCEDIRRQALPVGLP